MRAHRRLPAAPRSKRSSCARRAESLRERRTGPARAPLQGSCAVPAPLGTADVRAPRSAAHRVLATLHCEGIPMNSAPVPSRTQLIAAPIAADGSLGAGLAAKTPFALIAIMLHVVGIAVAALWYVAKEYSTAVETTTEM